jgi:2,4-dienoyl-CoA reductase-like NADH-dependent reductase (Old Yellow Enzyme family)
MIQRLLFPIRIGRRLRADAMERLVRLHAVTAAKTCPTIRPQELHLHVLRHSCAPPARGDDARPSTLVGNIAQCRYVVPGVTRTKEGRRMTTQSQSFYEPLFSPATIGRVALKNRVALAPMTRISATAEGLVTERIVSYYGVYANGGFGLLITEGLYMDERASQGYFVQPGIATPAHAEAWKPVVERVHAADAKIFAQLMHAGSQSQGNTHTTTTLAPSAVRPKGEQLAMYRGSGPYPLPEEMTAEQIQEVRQAFVTSAGLARDAGFDGVEIHGANGYLLDEFLTDHMNRRTDQYGGAVANRVRLAAEISRDVAAAVGPEIATGIRISQGKVSDNHHRWAGGEDDAAIIFSALAETGIDYIHTTEYRALAPAFDDGPRTLAELAKQHSGLPVIVNGHLDDPHDGAAIIKSGTADVVALAKPALANRNWPHLVRMGQTLAGDLPADLFGPVANLKDWELVSPDNNI